MVQIFLDKTGFAGPGHPWTNFWFVSLRTVLEISVFLATIISPIPNFLNSCNILDILFSIKGCKERNHDINKVEKIWKDWVAFASYAFNKSHSISYAILSAWTTYVKFTHPQEFFIALLMMAKNEADPFEQISKVSSELSIYNIKILRPDLVKS